MATRKSHDRSIRHSASRRRVESAPAATASSAQVLQDQSAVLSVCPDEMQFRDDQKQTARTDLLDQGEMLNGGDERGGDVRSFKDRARVVRSWERV